MLCGTDSVVLNIPNIQPEWWNIMQNTGMDMKNVMMDPSHGYI